MISLPMFEIDERFDSYCKSSLRLWNRQARHCIGKEVEWRSIMEVEWRSRMEVKDILHNDGKEHFPIIFQFKDNQETWSRDSVIHGISSLVESQVCRESWNFVKLQYISWCFPIWIWMNRVTGDDFEFIK